MHHTLLDAVEEAVALHRARRAHLDHLARSHDGCRRQPQLLDEVDDDEGALLELEPLELLLPADQDGALPLE